MSQVDFLLACEAARAADLDRDVAVEFQVPSPEHVAKRAVAQLAP